jgi:hypothetical protein
VVGKGTYTTDYGRPICGARGWRLWFAPPSSGGEDGKVGYRRYIPVAVQPGDGFLTEQIADARGCWRELVKMPPKPPTSPVWVRTRTGGTLALPPPWALDFLVRVLARWLPHARVRRGPPREFFPSVNDLTPLARLPELFCGAWADRPSVPEISDESWRSAIFQFGPCGQSRLPFGSFHVSRSSRLARSPGYSVARCGCARERGCSRDVSRHTENQLQLWRGDEAARTGC